MKLKTGHTFLQSLVLGEAVNHAGTELMAQASFLNKGAKLHKKWKDSLPNIPFMTRSTGRVTREH